MIAVVVVEVSSERTWPPWLSENPLFGRHFICPAHFAAVAFEPAPSLADLVVDVVEAAKGLGVLLEPGLPSLDLSFEGLQAWAEHVYPSLDLLPVRLCELRVTLGR